MPPYLNPITVLRLQDTEMGSIDARVLRKAKKRFFSEQFLDEREDIHYLGKHYTRHDLEAALERAEDPAWLSAYVAATAYPGLNRFLVGAPVSVRYVSAAVWQEVRLQPLLRTFLPEVYASALRRAYLQDDAFACAKLFSWPVLRYTDSGTAYGAVYQEVRRGQRVYQQAVALFLEDPDDQLAKQLYGAGLLRQYFPRESVRELPEYFHDLLCDAANVTLQLIRATQRTDPDLARGHLEYVSGFPGLTQDQRYYFARYLPGLTRDSQTHREQKPLEKKHIVTDRSSFSIAILAIIAIVFLISLMISTSGSNRRDSYSYPSTWPPPSDSRIQQLDTDGFDVSWTGKAVQQQIEELRSRTADELSTLRKQGDSGLLRASLYRHLEQEKELVDSLSPGTRSLVRSWQLATFIHFAARFKETDLLPFSSDTLLQ